MQQATLCFLMRGEDEILLAMKKRGFGVGKWNGVGGKPQDGGQSQLIGFDGYFRWSSCGAVKK